MKLRILVAVALAVTLAACAKKSPTAPVVVTPAGPAATTPTGVVKRLAWALQARDHVAYAELFTDDYRFQFAPGDSAGNAFRTSAWDRTLEAVAIQHMLSGGGAAPPVVDIKVTISDQLVARADPRPGMSLRWRKAVRTPIDLKITMDVGGVPEVTSITGHALFFVVRGDSAFFLPAREAEHDSTRWFISRWEDETAVGMSAPGLHANPTRSATLGSVKVRYLSPAAPAAPAGPR